MNVMWSLLRSTSHGGFSGRGIFRHVFTAVIAVLFLTLLAAPVTHAANASWTSDSVITYETNPYIGPAEDKLLEQLGLPRGTQAYTYVEPDPAAVMSGGSNSSNSPPADRLMHVLYVAEDVSIDSTTQMKYRTYTYNGPNSFTNPSTPTDVSIDSRANSSTQGTTSCDVSGGIGWIICPVTNFLAEGMDWVYQILAGFLTVQPLQTTQDNSLFRAWTYMRSFANVAFVIAFLIIIYSQISNLGLNNYDIKKMLPRLIIAALLVNLSYYICAIAIDLSNVIGWSLQDIFVNMRNTLVGPEGNGWQVTSWQSITGFILSSGTAVTAGTIGLFTTLTSYGIAGSLFLLLPALVTGLVAVLVALLIMAARQAIIIVLVIIAPLAFVAYLLPNTEKWFEKWRGLFMTMLILFPAFSVVFGGSQLAATAIIQNADSVNMIILGMMVQVAPLVVTPLLVRLSGSLLGRIAGLANNPQRGLIDRTRNFTKDRTDNIKARRLRNGGSPLMAGARWRDERRRQREDLAKAAGAEADSRWSNDRRYSTIDQRVRAAGDYKSLGEARSERQFNASKIVQDNQRRLTDPQRIGVELYNTQKELEEAKHEVDFQYNRLQAKRTKDNLYPEVLRRYGSVARHNYEHSQILKSQLASVESVIQGEYAKALEASAEMQKAAGGIDKYGARHALATAKAVIDEQMNKAIKEIESTTGVKAGNAVGLAEKLEEAVAENDMAAIVAYTNKLGKSQNNGIVELRRQLMMHEANVGRDGGLTRDQLNEWKLYIDANSDINVAAEDIGSWSREQSEQTLEQRWQSFDTWKDMTLEAWGRQKKSSQFASMRAGFIDYEKAKYITETDELRSGLKQSVIDELERIVSEGEGAPRKRPLNRKIISELNNREYDPDSDTLDDITDYSEILRHESGRSRPEDDDD